MLPIIPSLDNKWLANNPSTALGSFPPNLVEKLPEDTQKKIIRFMTTNYVWPQIQERRTFEDMWDKILQMYRIKLDQNDLNIDEATSVGQSTIDNSSKNRENVRVADSIVFDAVERLTNLTHFVSMKEGIPVQYNIPAYFDTGKEDTFYHPHKDKIKGGNALLAWNFDNEEVYRKHSIAAREFYKYGVVFCSSEFSFKVTMRERMINNQLTPIPEIVSIGTTFNPISIRRLWLNYRLNAFDMDLQPCPFYFDVMPRFATLQNAYHPTMNPFGFANLDKVATSGNINWLFTTEESSAMRKAIEGMTGLDDQRSKGLAELLRPEYSVEQVGTFYPMLPLDPETLEFEMRADNITPVPMSRFIVNNFGTNVAGQQHLLRVQRNFYPRDMLPIYGSSHMPDLDSGCYSPSLGYLLWNHYKEICTCKAQYLANKDWINDPPSWVLASSPASESDLTKKGAKINVNGANDFGWRTPYDATGTTVGMMTHLREQAQTSAKSGDAILGKALGGRTSATEASNAFQASMSSVTAPINMFNYDIMGGFANRVWEYAGSWFPAEILAAITGAMGFALKPEDLWIRVGLKWDVGSSYVESIVRQQNIRYMLETSVGDASINRAAMWKELLQLWKLDSQGEWVNDGGQQREIAVATEQAISAFFGKDSPINPDQNHQVAMKVKTRFLEDQESVWMTDPTYRMNAQILVNQIQIHQKFLMLQMQQQLLQMKLQQGQGALGMAPPALPDGQISAGEPATTPGQMMQQGGGKIA